jgi:hypothetical protein
MLRLLLLLPVQMEVIMACTQLLIVISCLVIIHATMVAYSIAFSAKHACLQTLT